VIFLRGLTYHLIKRYDEAIADLNRAIELDGDYKWAISNRGETYRLIKRYGEAISDFSRAIELDGDYDWAIAGRGATYLLSQQSDLALSDLNRALALDAESDCFYYLRALAHAQLHQPTAAQTDLATAIRIATAKVETSPLGSDDNWRNTLNHLAAGDTATAIPLYQSAHSAPRHWHDMAQQDLADLRSILPQHPHIQAMSAFLDPSFPAPPAMPSPDTHQEPLSR
jgi:tetratricopeptide (TPR) repeat protein